MSFLKSKFNGWLADGTRTPYMGGGGGGGQPAPTQSTSYSTNVPEYARPYVENMLQSAQKQVYNDDMTSFRPYNPYSSNVNDYFAGFSPLQQSAQQSAYYMQTPEQYGAATGLAAVSGLGALGAGQQYNQNVTDPARMQSFMSPYQQGVTDVAKNAAVREAQIAQNTQNLGAARQGTYGGARQALMQGERERNLLSNLSNIQAQGSQAAYDRALQSQQFGANLGMQGFGQAGQAASTLGQLGGQQLGAQKDIINLQNTMGREQQALEQSKINQAIQDYAIQQQYPMMQLGFLSNMIRGLPMQSQTTQLYQAQPSALQQGIGLAGAGASLFGGKAEGGEIKEMAEGGITGYKYGGIAEPKLAGMADNLSVPQLVERLKDPALTKGERDVFQEALAAKQNTAARSQGIAAAGGGLFNTMGYAGGGILAFAGDDDSLVNSGIDPETGEPYKSVDPIGRFSEFTNPFSGKGSFGSIARKGQSIEDYYKQVSKAPPATEADRKAQAQMEVQDIEGSKAKDPTAKAAPAGPSTGATGSKASSGAGSDVSGIGGILAGLRKEGPQGKLGEDRLSDIDKFESGREKRLDRKKRVAEAMGFLEFGGTAAPGGVGQAGIAGLKKYTEGYAKAMESDEKYAEELSKQKQDVLALRRAEERGDVKLAAELQEKIADRDNRLKTAQISASATGRAGEREDKAIQQIMKEKGVGYTEALQLYKRAGLNVENTDITRQKAADAALAGNIAYMRLANSKKPEDQQQAAQIRQQVYGQYGIGAGGIGGAQTTAVGNGNLVQNKDGSFNYVPK
jgi:hypothetical protein